MRILLNPAILFVLIWLVTLVLYGSYLSYILEPIKDETIIMIALSMISFLMPYLIYLLSIKKPILYPFFDILKYKYQIENRIISKKIKILVYIWLFASVIEIIKSGNLPFFSLLGIGGYVNYVDFGISGLHGLLNSIFLFLACFYFLKYKIEKKRKYLFILFLMFLWPILMTTRQLMMSFLIELLFIHLLTTNIDIKKSLKVFLYIIVAFLIFGFLGDLRSGRDNIISLARPTFDYPDYLPSFFIWVYLYITTPLNNINHNITTIEPSYVPFNIFYSTFPSFLRDTYSSLINIQIEGIELVTDSFNVSSFYEPFMLDFGYILLSLVLFLVSLFSIAVMHKANNNIVYVFILAVMLHNITLSVFANFITHIVFIFQMILSILIFKLKIT